MTLYLFRAAVTPRTGKILKNALIVFEKLLKFVFRLSLPSRQNR